MTSEVLQKFNQRVVGDWKAIRTSSLSEYVWLVVAESGERREYFRFYVRWGRCHSYGTSVTKAIFGVDWWEETEDLDAVSVDRDNLLRIIRELDIPFTHIETTDRSLIYTGSSYIVSYGESDMILIEPGGVDHLIFIERKR